MHHVVFIRIAPDDFDLGIDCCNSSKYSDSPIKDTQVTLGLQDEIDETRVVDDVDPVVPLRSFGGVRDDCDPPPPLLIHPFHGAP